DRYFAGVASMGFDAQVAQVADRTHKGSKRFLGVRSYQLAFARTLTRLKHYNLLIRIDGDQTIEGKRMLLAIGNGKRYGAGMHICPDAEVTDGKFTVTSVQRMSRITLLRFFPTVYEGDHLTHKSVETFEGESIHVDSTKKKKCLYQVDGEILGYLPETFVTKPNFLTVRVPDPWISYSEIWEGKLRDAKGFTNPFTGNKLLLAKLLYLNPISNYKRGLDWSQSKEEVNAEEQSKDEVKSINEENYLYVKEKHFSKRVIFFLLRTFFQTLSLSVAFTAPIVFPWFFDIVFPNLLALIPQEIGAFVQEVIDTIQSFFVLPSWVESIIRFFMDLSAIFNPFLVFSLIMIFFKQIGALAEEEYHDPFSSANGTPTSTGYFLDSIRRKFSFDFSSATLILLIVSSCVSFFLVIRRARGILFEVMTTKEEIRHRANVRKVFLKYCKEGTYTEIDYTKNRLSESKKTKTFANLVKYGPMVSLIIPAILAILFILL
ncbi:MAG: diacylglycerol/lipid kinase family protein, partial [Candidatus Hodarchaeales archaeon]